MLNNQAVWELAKEYLTDTEITECFMSAFDKLNDDEKMYMQEFMQEIECKTKPIAFAFNKNHPNGLSKRGCFEAAGKTAIFLVNKKTR